MSSSSLWTREVAISPSSPVRDTPKDKLANDSVAKKKKKKKKKNNNNNNKGTATIDN